MKYALFIKKPQYIESEMLKALAPAKVNSMRRSSQ